MVDSTSESGKVSRTLTVSIEPMRGEKFSVSVTDATTRSKASDRTRTAHITADIWTRGAAMDSFSEVLKAFVKTLKDEDPGELFADEKSAKPRLDK